MAASMLIHRRRPGSSEAVLVLGPNTRHVRCIEVILSGKADEREQAITAGVGESCAHQLRLGYVSKAAHRPGGCNPLPRTMRERGGEQHGRALAIDVGGLKDRQLVPAEC